MTAPELSVVMPVRAGADTLAAAVRSVLERADGLLEIVVVDDGPDDGAPAREALLDPRVRVVPGRRAGVAAARNDGVRAARGGLVGFLDADDEWLAIAPDPRRGLLADRGHDAVAIGHTQLDVGGRRTDSFLLWSFGAVLAPRGLLAVHPVDEALERGEDLEWFLRVRDAGVALLETRTAVQRYRRQPGSLSAVPSTGLLAGLRRTIERRRETPAG